MTRTEQALLEQYAADIKAAEAQKTVRPEYNHTRTETHTVPMTKLNEALGIIRDEGGFVLQSVQVGMDYQITVAL